MIMQYNTQVLSRHYPLDLYDEYLLVKDLIAWSKYICLMMQSVKYYHSKKCIIRICVKFVESAWCSEISNHVKEILVHIFNRTHSLSDITRLEDITRGHANLTRPQKPESVTNKGKKEQELKQYAPYISNRHCN